MQRAFDIYTDGSCPRNPGGRGGWAYIVLEGGREIGRHSGSVECATNNRMEMLAAINGLLAVAAGARVIVYSDSQYLVKGASSWCQRWQRNRWHMGSIGNGRPVKNADLWRLLVEVKAARHCQFQWVRGHNGDQWNEACDRLADREARALRLQPDERLFAAFSPVI